MKKLFTVLFCVMLGISAIAQQKIQLRSADRAECTKSDMTSLKASFSFSTIEAEEVATKGGDFAWLSMPNTVIGGNEGDPQIPVVNQLIAVPVGAEPTITVTSYSTKEYNLTEMGIKTLIPRQPSVRKDKNPDEVPFVKNEAAYQSTRGFKSEPTATVKVEGTMRGVRLGKMTIEPVSYDPVNNKIRVFNDIEVEVSFNGADAKATEDLLIDTYSPYFDIVYKQLFNGRAVTSVYDEHPDLYSTPVKMLVVTTSTYANSTAFQNWLTWKKQKGIDVDIYTVTSSTSSSTIRSGIQSRYNTNHPSFLVIVGDETVVTYYQLWDYDSSYGDAATDLEYASVDGDIYHDMFISRMPVSSTTELGNLVNKILTYEKYTMSDPSYLDETLLIAGWDSNATAVIGTPTIQYASNYYFNSAHGINAHVFCTTASGQTTCYNYINNVGFVNYTAHGDIQKWHDPQFTNSNVNSLTNNDKYFWAMGNCCLTANFKNSSNSQTCFGETMVRAANKGAFGYIGSVPESLWYEDYYFALGATNTFGQMPTQSQTATGAYDALFDDTGFNTLNSVPYIGDIAVSYASSGNYEISGENGATYEEYYWRAYQCFGDGSVMPYLKNPAANTVSHNSQIVAGTSSFRVNADSRSYVSITVNNEIIGVAAVPANATYVDVPFTTTPVAGTTAMIVVTRNQRQPYINAEVPVINNSAPQYDITTTANPAAGGTVSGAGTYYEGSSCTLTATANRGYEFVNWTKNNSVVSTNATYTFEVTADGAYTANFTALEQPGITYNATQEHGTIGVNPGDAYEGEIVYLTATPASGYELDHWEVNTVGKGNVEVLQDGEGNDYFIMPNKAVTVSATFKVAPSNATVDFETGNISELSNTFGATITNDASHPWVVTTAKNHTTNGTYCIKSSIEGQNSQTSSIEMEVIFDRAGSISFYCWASCESATSNWDYGMFYIDGTQQGSNFLHVTDWVYQTYDVAAGTHVFKWTYRKDGSSAGGDDCFYVDDINIDGFYIPTCPKPTNVAVNNPTAHGATVSWIGTSDSYIVMVAEPVVNADYNFETGSMPSAFTNDATNPWTVVANTHSGAYCAKSAGGFSSTNSDLVLTVNMATAGSVDFSALVSSESGWDFGRLLIDGIKQLEVSGTSNSWADYSYPLTAGSHTLTWRYYKDSSGNQGDDCFYVDDIVIKTEPSSWNQYPVSASPYTINDATNIAPATDYIVKVVGVCSGEQGDPSAAVSFTTEATCPAPTGLAVNYTGGTEATVSWTSEASAWNMKVNGVLVEDVITNPYTLTGLEFTTTYEVKVQADCGDDQSEWAGPVSFKTECGPKNLPYSYGFEVADELDCWNVIATSSSTGITTASDAPEGTHVFKFHYSEQNAYLVSPVLNGTELGLGVSFQYMNSSTTTSYTEEFKVGYTSDETAASADFTYGETIEGENEWKTYENIFPANTKRIAIKYIYTDGMSLRLDDFSFEIPSACRKPTDFAVSEIGGHSAKLSWTENGEATEWILEYESENDEKPTTITVNTNSYTLTGLEPETMYAAQVTPVCEVDKPSEIIYWTTDVACSAPTSLAVSDITTTSAVVSWNGEAAEYNLRYRELSAADFVTVTLTADDVWQDGTGYQMLLDADANTYGTIIPTGGGLTDGGDASAATYAEFEYKIPTNADGAMSTTNVVIAQSISIQIPAGTYDWCITNPTPGDRIWIATDGRADDYVFEAGKTYEFHVYYNGGNDAVEVTITDITKGEPKADWISINGVTSPYTLTTLEPATDYTVEVQSDCGGDGTSAWTSTNFSTPSNCGVPTPLDVTELEAYSATLNWTGVQENYQVQYRTAGSRELLFFEDFDGQPSTWTLTNSAYSRTSSATTDYLVFMGQGTTEAAYLITPDLTGIVSKGTVEFNQRVYNGTATFKVGFSSTTNEVDEFDWGTEVNAAAVMFTAYSVAMPAGTKYVAITTTTSESDCAVLINDFGIYGNEIPAGEWNTATVNNATTYAISSGLKAETKYEWQVRGVNSSCTGGYTEWSELRNFTTPASCLVPTNIHYNEGQLSWTSGATLFDIQVEGESVIEGVSNPYAPTLDPETIYSVRVRANCGGGDYSDWTDYYAFVTECDGTKSMPYAFDFEDTGTYYACWGAVSFNSENSVGLTYDPDDDTNIVFLFSSYSNSTDFRQILISPELSTDAPVVVSFDYKAYSGTETFQVGYCTASTYSDITDFTFGDAQDVDNTTWETYTETLPIGTKYVAVLYSSNYQYYLFLDNFSFANPTINYWDASYWGGIDEIPEIDDDVTIGGTVIIPAGTVAYANTITLAYDGQLIIEDGGQLYHNDDVIATLEKDIVAYTSKDSDGWYLISTPVDNINVSSVFSGTYDLYMYDEPTAYWWSHSGTLHPFTKLNMDNGYLYASDTDQTLEFTGDMMGTEVKDITLDLAYTASQTDDVRGFNLMGNPFTRNLRAGDMKIGGVDLSTYMAAENGTALTTHNISEDPIKPGRGFFVQATAAGQELIFNPSSAKSETNNGYIKIVVANENSFDNAFINIANGNTLRKMNIANTMEVYVINEDEDYAAARVEELEGKIPVNFKAVADGEYTITISANNVEARSMYLRDNFSGETIDLLESPSYTFKATANDDEARFTLLFDFNNYTGIDENLTGEIFAYQYGNEIIVNGEGELQVFDVMGRMVLNTQVNGVQKVNVPANAVYIFRMVGETIQTQKIVVR